MLSKIQIEDDYAEWIEILAATHDATDGSADGMELAKNWSETQPDYDADSDGLIDEKWPGFTPHKPGGATVGKLIAKAREGGWDSTPWRKKASLAESPIGEKAKSLSEAELAEILARDLELDIRYDWASQTWFVWDRDKALWRRDATGGVFQRARSIAIAHHERGAAGICRKLVESALAMVRSDLPVGEGAWDADPWLLCVPGGHMDLRTGKLDAPKRELMMS